MKLLLIIIGLLIPTTVTSNTRNNTQSLGQDFYEESELIPSILLHELDAMNRFLLYLR